MSSRSHRVAQDQTARCVVYGYGQARTLPTPTLIRLRLNVSCSARHVAAAASKSNTAIAGAPLISDIKGKTTARRRGKPIEVWVTDGERSAITAKADEAGMSRSGYLRALALNTPIRSVVDLAAVADLAKESGDLGRAAGLLKLWLAEKRGKGASAIDVESVMLEFRRLQVIIAGRMGAIVRTSK